MEKQREEFPYEVTDMEPELVEKLKNHFRRRMPGFVRVGPNGYFLSSKYKENAANFYNMPVRSDDVFINTFPRSGTTWTQEMIWLLQNNMDFEKARNTPLPHRFLFLDTNILDQYSHDKKMLENYKHDEDMLKAIEIRNRPMVSKLAAMPSPRFIKSHLPLSLLPPNLLNTAKVVYVARDPRDVAVSYYHYSKPHICDGAPEIFKTYWNLFIKSQVFYAPIFQHVKEAWNQRNHPNMLFIFYEEIHKDLKATVHKVADFLGKKYTEEQMQQLCDHLGFKNFKNNSSVNHSVLNEDNLITTDFRIIRKGQMGGWREYFDEEMMEQAEKWFEENLRDTDLQYLSCAGNVKKKNTTGQRY